MTTKDDTVDVDLIVNGRRRCLGIAPGRSLLNVLHKSLGLTGAEKGCNRGECVACTVHRDGQRIVSCVAVAVAQHRVQDHDDRGSGRLHDLHPVQAAFLDEDALQCGFYTPGQIISDLVHIGEGHVGETQKVRDWMSGNIGRCGAYPQIVLAVVATATRDRPVRPDRANGGVTP